MKNDVVVSTGYNGSPRGYDNCCDIGVCPRMERDMHQGEGYDICRAIYAEQNALLNCSREQTMGADLYLTGVNPSDNSIHPGEALSALRQDDHPGGNPQCDHANRRRSRSVCDRSGGKADMAS